MPVWICAVVGAGLANALPGGRRAEFAAIKPAGTLAKGSAADLCLFDPESIWQVTAGALPGKAQNTPFDGRALEGRVLSTFKAGRSVFG